MGWFIFIVIVAGVIFYSVQSAKKVTESWITAARMLHLNYSDEGFFNSGTISGKCSGHRVLVSTYTRGSGKSSQVYTKYQLKYRSHIPLYFKITRQGILHGLGQLVGFQDVEVGNPSFDDMVVLQGRRPAKMIEFLTIEKQNAIRKIMNAYSSVIITNEHVEIDLRGKESSSTFIRHCVNHLEVFGNNMVGDSRKRSTSHRNKRQIPTGVPVIKTAPPPLPIELEPASEPQAPKIPEPPKVEEVVQMPELPKLPEIPKVPEVPTLDDLDVESALENVEEPAVVSTEEKEEGAVLEISDVAMEIYGKDLDNSVRSSNTFEKQYKDKWVKGSGTLKRVNKFNYDPVFVNSSGVKATIEVCELDGSYSKIIIVAEIKFPTEQYDMLSAKVDENVSFEGVLIGQDSLMHKLFVATK